MSHLENSTGNPQQQPPATHSYDCGGLFFETGLIRIQEGYSADEALELARALSCGVEQIAMRIHDQLNNGELVYIDEMKAVSFLGCIVASLIQSSRRGLELAGGEQ